MDDSMALPSSNTTQIVSQTRKVQRKNASPLDVKTMDRLMRLNVVMTPPVEEEEYKPNPATEKKEICEKKRRFVHGRFGSHSHREPLRIWRRRSDRRRGDTEADYKSRCPKTP